MQVLMVYSETGGATKTTSSVSLAMTAAENGKKVVLFDLDPRAASTKWLGLEPSEEWRHVGAILGNDDPTGWAEDLAIQSHWSPNLRLVPSARAVSNRESDRADHAELRLKMSLEGLNADLVVIDCPNRQGGPLIQAALTASDTVVYAATPTKDGVDGVLGAQRSVRRFKKSRELIGAPTNLTEAGIIVGGLNETIMSRLAVNSIEELRETGMLLTPLVPNRTIVGEARVTGEWFGKYRKGQPVVDAYNELAKEIVR
ncbi:ATPase [Arthrobacter woluwensis]|uniref:ParA family protein n=1 Tax=Arthrobacter woluwensis TaxID=156980 RepID=UPI000D132EE7|nr:ParA family protein [Arthrobacter woluwensis]PSS43131.1 ATPase [Arthrobacter woluwensis]